MRLFFVLLIFLVSLTDIYAQRRLKYNNVYEVVKEGNRDKSYSLLLAFQKQDPEFANTYFQLAMIAEFWAKDYDPLTEPELVRFFSYNTKLYYGLAELKLKEESKGNREYYENGGISFEGKKLTLEEISTYVASKAEEMEKYEKDINEITDYYGKSVEFYNYCVESFNNLNGKYAKIKNIYLSEDAELVPQLDSLKTAFDSAIYYFNKYRKKLDEFPIKNYNQNFKLKPIVTYRLDGLTQSNFLENEIMLWDYNAWVKDVKRIMQSTIKENRNDIESVNTELNKDIEKFKLEKYSDDFRRKPLDLKFIYKIEKYDSQSLLVALFRYKDALADFLHYFRKELNRPSSVAWADLKKHTEYLQILNSKKEHADSMLTLADNRINAVNIRKYKNFYMTEYNGMPGIREYIKNEKQFIRKQTEIAYERYKQNILNNDIFRVSEKNTFNLTGNKTITKADKTDTEGLHYTAYVRDNKNIWLCGYDYKDGNYNDFLCLTDTSGTPKFFERGKDVGAKATHIAAYEESAIYSVRLAGESSGIGNVRIIKSDNKGRMQVIKEFETPLFPVYLGYDGLNGEIMLVLGTAEQAETSQKFEIYRFSEETPDNLTATLIRAEADLFDAFKSDNNLLLFLNYRTYTDTQNRIKTASARRNILIVSVSPTGIIEYFDYPDSQSMIGVKAVKLNSNNISISGLFSDYESDEKLLESKPLFFMQIDKTKAMRYANWRD